MKDTEPTSGIIKGPPTVFVAPVGTSIPTTAAETADPDGPWELLMPRTPDYPPEADYIGWHE